MTSHPKLVVESTTSLDLNLSPFEDLAMNNYVYYEIKTKFHLIKIRNDLLQITEKTIVIFNSFRLKLTTF